MGQPKTQITDQDPAEFIAAVEPSSKRDDAQVLDRMFRKVTGQPPLMWGASIIGYGQYRTTYASGRDVHWMRAGFSPRKAKHSLYLMGGYCDEIASRRTEEQLSRLGKHARGKSCLYINKLADVDLAVLEEMITADWETMLRIYPES
ncbi:MAG: DUF1801 domain-containing protein [Erythrobacter sp.]